MSVPLMQIWVSETVRVFRRFTTELSPSCTDLSRVALCYFWRVHQCRMLSFLNYLDLIRLFVGLQMAGSAACGFRIVGSFGLFRLPIASWEQTWYCRTRCTSIAGSLSHTRFSCFLVTFWADCAILVLQLSSSLSDHWAHPSHLFRHFKLVLPLWLVLKRISIDLCQPWSYMHESRYLELNVWK